MPDPGCSARWSASHASRCWAVRQPDHAEPQRRAVERAAEHQDVGVGRGVRPRPELLGHVGGHPRVGGGGGRQHRDAGGQVGEQGAQPAVVGPEVVPPVGDAVRLVHDQQAGGGRQPGQHLVAEPGVVQPLGGHQQHVDLPGRDRVLDLLPLLDVGGVDGDRPDPGPLGGGDLVAHQRQQRGDDHRGAGAAVAQQRGGHEVHRGLPPARPLDDQGAAAVDDQRLDRRPLVVAELGVVSAHEGAQVLLGGGAGGGGSHAPVLPARADARFPARRRTNPHGDASDLSNPPSAIP